MPLYGKFNEKAQRVLENAQQTAMGMKHKYLGTEHLLLGLLKEARNDVTSLPDHITSNMSPSRNSPSPLI